MEVSEQQSWLNHTPHISYPEGNGFFKEGGMTGGAERFGRDNRKVYTWYNVSLEMVQTEQAVGIQVHTSITGLIFIWKNHASIKKQANHEVMQWVTCRPIAIRRCASRQRRHICSASHQPLEGWCWRLWGDQVCSVRSISDNAKLSLKSPHPFIHIPHPLKHINKHSQWISLSSRANHHASPLQPRQLQDCSSVEKSRSLETHQSLWPCGQGSSEKTSQTKCPYCIPFLHYQLCVMGSPGKKKQTKKTPATLIPQFSPSIWSLKAHMHVHLQTSPPLHAPNLLSGSIWASKCHLDCPASSPQHQIGCNTVKRKINTVY